MTGVKLRYFLTEDAVQIQSISNVDSVNLQTPFRILRLKKCVLFSNKVIHLRALLRHTSDGQDEEIALIAKNFCAVCYFMEMFNSVRCLTLVFKVKRI